MSEEVLPAPTARDEARVMKVLVIVAMVFPCLATWIWFVLLADSAAAPAAFALSKIVQFGFPAAVCFWLRRKPPFWRGEEVGSGRAIAAGALVGLAIAALIVLGYALLFRGGPAMVEASGAIARKVASLHFGTPQRFAALALFYALLHSGLEEGYWRWLVFGTLKRNLPAGAAIVVSSLAFTAHHVVVLNAYFHGAWGMTVLASSGVFVGGLVWALLYHRTGSLASVWLSHALADGALMAIGYDVIWPIGSA